MATGRTVLFPERDPVGLAYFTPDGSYHWAIGGFFDPIPADAVLPPNLVGAWLLGGSMASDWPGKPAAVGLLPDGRMTGQVYMFAAIPPISVNEGKWWWQAAISTLTLSFRLTLEEMILAFEMRCPMPVTSITNTQIVSSLFGDPVIFARIPT